MRHFKAQLDGEYFLKKSNFNGVLGFLNLKCKAYESIIPYRFMSDDIKRIVISSNVKDYPFFANM